MIHTHILISVRSFVRALTLVFYRVAGTESIAQCNVESPLKG